MEEEIKQEEVKEEEAEQPKPKGPEDLEKPLDKMTAPELRDLAMGMGFTGVHAMKKEELLVSIKEEWGIKDEEPAKKKAGKITEVSALKQKIVRLKAEKEAAREGKDKKRVNVLRKRINRLKKMSRQSVKA